EGVGQASSPASWRGVSPPLPRPAGGTPAEPAGEDACPTLTPFSIINDEFRLRLAQFLLQGKLTLRHLDFGQDQLPVLLALLPQLLFELVNAFLIGPQPGLQRRMDPLQPCLQLRHLSLSLLLRAKQVRPLPDQFLHQLF